MYSANEFIKNTFGKKVYKISLDAGFTCPNRDGTKGTKGCIFCSGGGSGDFSEKLDSENLDEQIEKARSRISGKYKGNSFIAYFQAFTNTYGSAEKLRSIYLPVIGRPDIAGLSIATRPDCLDPDIISLIKELNRIKPVWVELGLQTIHPKTAEYIRRGYDLSVYDKAVESLKTCGVHIITHVIIGLPGETPEEMLETVEYVVRSGSHGIKLQLLHVLEGTDLAQEYRAGHFKTLTLEEYTDIIIRALELIPDTMVVHRITGDGPKKLLIAPLWSADKKRTMNTLNAAISKKMQEQATE